MFRFGDLYIQYKNNTSKHTTIIYIKETDKIYVGVLY